MFEQYKVKFKSGEVSVLDPVDDNSYYLKDDTYTLSGILSGTWIATPIINNKEIVTGLSVFHKDHINTPAELLVYNKIKSATGFIGFMDKTYLIKLKLGFDNMVGSKKTFNNTIINATEEHPNTSVVFGRVVVADIRCDEDDYFSLYATHTDAGRVISMSIILNK